MDIGVCFAIFIVVSIILLFLFCLLLKCFEHLQKKKRKQQNLQFQTLQETNQSDRSQDYQGAYEQYCEKQQQNNRQLNESLLEQDKMIEFSLKQQITKISNDLYGLSCLRQKLNRQVDNFDSFSNCAMIPLKQLSFDRIKTMQTNADSYSQRIGYEFIKKIMCYCRQGIKIMEVEVQSLSKKEQKIMLKKTVQQNIISEEQLEFQNYLQTLGFQKLIYTCFKIVCCINTTSFKNNSTYSMKFLEVQQRKSQISLEEYQRLLDNIKNNDQVSAKISQ